MKDLKITQVQIDCRELSQEQIDKIFYIAEKHGYIKDSECNIINGDLYYLRSCYKEFGIYVFNSGRHTITYKQFIKLFDKPKSNLKKRFKKLEDRVALLEQKLSEKEAESNLNINKVVDDVSIDFEKGMKFKSFNTDKEYEIKDISHDMVELYIPNESISVYSSVINIENNLKKGDWILLPTTPENNTNQPDTKEETPLLTKGCVALFWDDDANDFEIGHYCESPNPFTGFKHKNSMSEKIFKNARPLTKEEVIKILFGE